MRSKLVVPSSRNRTVFGLRPERAISGSVFILVSLLLAYLGVIGWAYPLGAVGFLVFYLLWFTITRLAHARRGSA